jgi:uncharacterized protein DUF3592
MRSVASCVLVIIGIALSAWQGMKAAELQASGIRTEGVVVRMQPRDHVSYTDSYADYTDYHAIVRFHTQDNQTIEFEDVAGEPLPIFPSSRYAGKKVTVLYLANDPKHYAMIDRGPFSNWLGVALSPSLYFR